MGSERMRGKSRRKTEPRRWQQPPQEGEGSRWELILFGLFFVTVVFVVGTYARADVRPADRYSNMPTAKSYAASTAPQTLGSRIAFHPVATGSPASAADGATTTNFENRLQTRGLRTKKKASRTFEFAGQLTLEATRTLDPDTETNSVGNIQVQPTVIYTPWNFSANLQFIYNREFVYERDDGTNGDIDDVRYGFRKTWRRGRDFQTNSIDEAFVGLGGFLPASRMSKKRGFNGSIGPRFGLMKKLGRFTFASSLLYTRSGYNEDIDADGRTHVADAYTSVLNIAFAITDRLSLTGAVDYTYFVDYQSVDSGAERAVVGLGYKWLENFTTVAGVATSRATIDSTGQTELFKFYDKESALAYFDLVVSI